MARPKTRSKPRPRRANHDTANAVRFGRRNGLGVPDNKARKILAAYVAGLGLRQIAGAFNTSHHTIRAIIANRKDLLAEVERASQQGAVPPALLRDRLPAPQILCPSANEAEFSGPVTDNVVSDIFGFLRNADFTAQRAGIYFLFRGGTCVYVGQSKCVAGRCGQHLFYDGARLKAFDRVLYAPVAAHVIAPAETALIRALKPEYNRQRYVGGIPLAA